MRALDAAPSSLWAPGAAAGGPLFGASPASECALRCEGGCTAGATRSTGTEGVGERYTALWPAQNCAQEMTGTTRRWLCVPASQVALVICTPANALPEAAGWGQPCRFPCPQHCPCSDHRH